MRKILIPAGLLAGMALAVSLVTAGAPKPGPQVSPRPARAVNPCAAPKVKPPANPCAPVNPCAVPRASN